MKSSSLEISSVKSCSVEIGLGKSCSVEIISVELGRVQIS